MAFFASMPRHIRSPLIFIDGNHDYEYAAFDVRAAARVVARGGYLVIDNISQLGPYRAGCELLEGEPGWVECGHSSRRYDPARPFDAHRTTIHNTDLMVLRAPDHLIVSSRPVTTGQIPIKDRNIKAIELSPVGEVSGGTLSMQIISRSFGERQIEHTTEMQTDLQGAGLVQLDIHPPFHPPSDATAVTAEIWLSWAGSTDLRLSCTPRVLSI